MKSAWRAGTKYKVRIICEIDKSKYLKPWNAPAPGFQQSLRSDLLLATFTGNGEINIEKCTFVVTVTSPRCNDCSNGKPVNFYDSGNTL